MSGLAEGPGQLAGSMFVISRVLVQCLMLEVSIILFPLLLASCSRTVDDLEQGERGGRGETIVLCKLTFQDKDRTSNW